MEDIKKELSGESSTGIIAQGNQNFNLEKLISQGIEKGLTVDTMERLLAMRKDLKAEWAKEQFTMAMANFQAECPVIEKGKPVMNKDARTIRYKYAPIEMIVKQVGELLKKNGFSYSTDTKMNGTAIVTVKATHIAGHSETSTVEIPLQPDAYMSEAQKAMSAVTFGKRYAFCNVFGILTGDEDTDDENNLPQEQLVPIPHATNSTPQQVYKPAPVQGILKPASPAQINLIKKNLVMKGITEEDLINEGFEPLSKATMAGARECIDWLFKQQTKIINA